MKDKKIFLMLMGVVLLLLLSPLIFNIGFFDKVFTSGVTYFNLIELNSVDSSLPFFDRVFNHNFFHVVLDLLNLDDVLLALFVPLVSGLLSVLLVFLISRKLNLSDNETVFIIALFVLSPIFLHKFTTLNPDNFAFPLFLLTVLLYFERYSFFAIIPLVLLSFINPVFSVIFVLFLVMQLLLKNGSKVVNFVLIFVGVTFSILSFFFNLVPEFVSSVTLDDVLIEFGSLSGYSIPLIILSAVGVFSWWGRRVDKTLVVSSLFVGFVISFFLPDARLVVALGLGVFAGLGINHLISLRWELSEIKNISLMLIFYIILFSSIVTINTQVTQVNSLEVEAAKFLASLNSEGVVLSTPDKGFMIEYLSGKQVFLDGNSFRDSDYFDKKSVMDDIFYARLLSDLTSALEDNNIKYLFIHKSMRDGDVWTSRQEGLQFFLVYSENFISLFDNEVVQIYMFIPN